jgi:hypothetical protein
MRPLVSRISEHCLIDQSLAAAPVDKDWLGSHRHLGPEGYTPLKKALEYKHSAALVSLMSGSLCWMIARFRGLVDVTISEELVEALFCFQVNPAYLVPNDEYRFIPDTKEDSLPEGAQRTFLWNAFKMFDDHDFELPLYPPRSFTSRAISLTRHVMPKRYKAYDAWVEKEIALMDRVAAFPDPLSEPLPGGSSLEVRRAEARRAHGHPLSPVAMDPSTEYDPVLDKPRIDEALQLVRWQDNRFLRNPSEVSSSGFEGTPYRCQS